MRALRRHREANVSRAKKNRARDRRRAAAAPPTLPPARPRIEATRRRIAVAKAAVAGLAVLAFGGTFALSRVSYAGHTKKPLRPLAAPPRYISIVRRNLLEAGIVAPTEAPPGAATASS